MRYFRKTSKAEGGGEFVERRSSQACTSKSPGILLYKRKVFILVSRFKRLQIFDMCETTSYGLCEDTRRALSTIYSSGVFKL